MNIQPKSDLQVTIKYMLTEKKSTIIYFMFYSFYSIVSSVSSSDIPLSTVACVCDINACP